MGWCGEIQGGVGVWGSVRRCGEVQGGVKRCGECGEVQEVAHCLPFPADQLAQLPVVLLPLEALSVGAHLLWPTWKSERRREQGTTLLFS